MFTLMNKAVALSVDKKQAWLRSPSCDHFVEYYPYDKVLMESLETYVLEGLIRNESCLVIATKHHLDALEASLSDQGIDCVAAKAHNQYRTLDAEAILKELMPVDKISSVKFESLIGATLVEMSASGQKIRAFGEIVALLWQRNKLDALLELEELWNQMQLKYEFSLFCAYPQIHFDRSVHRSVLDQISHAHCLAAPEF